MNRSISMDFSWLDIKLIPVHIESIPDNLPALDEIFKVLAPFDTWICAMAWLIL